MLPPAPPFDESMLPPGSMRPVFPPETTVPPPSPDVEAQAVAAAAVKTRAAFLAGLNQDSEFKAHVIDGWLQEQESEALSRLSGCEAADVIEARATWKTVKDLRSKLRDELQSAALKMKT